MSAVDSLSTPTGTGRILTPMIDFAAMHRVRNHPVFAGYFAAVLPIFWPVLFWNLLRMAERMKGQGNCDALIVLHWWGGIEITHYGDPAPSPSAYRPITPTRKAWSDPIWSSSVPAEITAAETHTLFFPCFSGGFEGKAFALQTPREGMKGACALSLHADTS